MKTLRKIGSAVVILVMLASFLPVSVQPASAASLPGTQIDLSTLSSTYTISKDGTYSFYGSGSYAINVTSGSPTIVLSDATINVSSGPAINITGGSPTIKVEGSNTVQCSGSSSGAQGAGIYVAQGSSVTITADDRSSILTARAGRDGAGIGGHGSDSDNYLPCGNITITNVTVHAYSATSQTCSPGIGSRTTSGTITIDNATVYAYGTGQMGYYSPAIGASGSLPIINILHGSTVYAYRGAYSNLGSRADYIGQGSMSDSYTGGQIQTAEGGSITNSTIHIGNYNNNGASFSPTETTEKPNTTPDTTPFPIEITATTGATAAEGYATGPTLSVTATDSNLSYQWYKDSVFYANQIDGATNASYQVEAGLSVGEHTYKCVVKSGNYTLASDPITFTVKNSQTATPDAPSGATATTNSVTLNTVTGSGQGAVQYGYTTGSGSASDINNWQTSTEFSGLSAGTDYTFYTRYAGNDTYAPSDPSATGLTVTTLPAITTTSLGEWYVGVENSVQLSASVANGKTVTWALASGSSLPANLTLSENGTISGSPSATGTTNFTVQATIKGGQNGTEDITNTANLSITINAGTPDITATTYNDTTQTDTFTYGDTITVTGMIAASATDPGTSTNAITQNQVGLYLGETELVTSDVDGDGNFTLTYDTRGKGITPDTSAQTLTVRYGGSSDLNSGETTVSITLNKATPEAPVGPVATSSIETTSVTLMVDDPSTSPYGDIQYGYTTGSGSASDINNWQIGTEFSNLQPGTDYIFYARYVGNDFYNSSPASENSLTVTTRPEITTTSLDTGYVGVYYEAQLSANVDSVKNVTWSIPTSSLPTGLQLSGNTISGTPTATGTFSFIVQASIGGGLYGNLPTDSMVTLTITINAITEPAQNQVGLYLGDNQLATATVTDGSFTLEYDTSDKDISIGANQTLTVKYGGSSDLTSGEATVTITLNQKPVTATFTGPTTKVYDETTAVPSDLTVALSKEDVVGGDDVTVSADSITYDNANVGENKTITASGITLSGGDADWYSLSNETVTTTGSITKQAQDAPAEGVGYTIDYGAETITVTSGDYELSADSTAISGSSTLDVTPGTDVYIRFKETDTQEASDWTTVDIPSRPSAPQNVRGGTNSITNVDSTMAYSADGETWTAITGERVTNLRAGSYLVRFQATYSAFASESASVTVRDYVAPPTTPSEPEKPSGPSTGDSDGWTSILDEILDAEDGDTITIDMNGETEVPGEIFEAVADRNVTVIFEMGEDVSWTVNGNDVPADTAFDTIDLGVSMNTDGIPVEVINAITGEATSVQITLAHDGDFGFALTLSAPLGEENAGYWANLYHYKVNGGEADREDPLGDDEDTEAMDFETAALIDDDGTANLRMTHASQYAIVIDDHPHETVLPFTDVNANDWFYDPVVWAYGQGLMTGTSATTFEPNTSTTRAMIVAILNRLEDGPTADGGTFTDVADGDWYADAVNWAASVGIVAGFEDGTFRPNAPITREQMAAILYNYAQWKGYDVSNRADLSRYSDQPSAWANDVMQWAVAEGLISGTSATTLDPQAATTRAQTAAIFQRFLTAQR